MFTLQAYCLLVLQNRISVTKDMISSHPQVTLLLDATTWEAQEGRGV